MSTKDLAEAVEDLKEAIIGQYGALPSEIADEFDVLESLINEPDQPEITTEEEKSL